MTIWVVVADAARARFFSAEKPNAALTELEDRIHPSSRFQAHELGTDSPSRVFDSQGHGRHAVEPPTDVHEQQAIEFARELDGYLEEMCNAGRYGKLYVIAPPHFLGLLRGHFSPSVAERVAEAVDKDLTKHSVEEIRAHLPEFL